MKRIMSWTVMLLVLLGAGTEASAAVVNLSDYFFPTPLSRSCRYSYVIPAGYPGFTITVTKLTNPPYAGHYRWGDYNIPGGEEAVWRIADFDRTSYIQSYLLYADSLIGDLPSPASIRATYDTETIYQNPVGSSTSKWYFRHISSLNTGGKTYQDVLLWAVLDAQYPSGNQWNTNLGLQGLPAVTVFTFYAKGIGELIHADIDAQSGNTNYQYELQSTGVPNSPAGAALLLLD
jgi:hypothetical protein